jgi:hypothetical protein
MPVGLFLFLSYLKITNVCSRVLMFFVNSDKLTWC